VLTSRVRSWQLAGGEFGPEPGFSEEVRQALTESLVPMQAYSMVGSLMNMVAANVSQCFDFGGPSFTMDAACSSALVALHEGVWQLRAGLVDAAVVGGVYLAFTPDNFVAFTASEMHIGHPASQFNNVKCLVKLDASLGPIQNSNCVGGILASPPVQPGAPTSTWKDPSAFGLKLTRTVRLSTVDAATLRPPAVTAASDP